MKRYRFYADFGLGFTKQEMVDVQNDVDLKTKYDNWVKQIKIGWDEMEDAPSIYKDFKNQKEEELYVDN